jgi:hypothetical protein
MQTAVGVGAPLDMSGYNLRPFYENDFSRPQKISREEVNNRNIRGADSRRKHDEFTHSRTLAYDLSQANPGKVNLSGKLDRSMRNFSLMRRNAWNQCPHRSGRKGISRFQTASF